MTCERVRPRVSVSFGFCAVLAALLSVDGGTRFLPALLGCAVHEGGHMLAARLLGMEIREIRFSALGIRMEGNTAVLGHWRRAWISLAGPAANLLALYPAYLLGPDFAAVQLLLFLFHILPAVPLDGGAALYSMLCARTSPDRAERWITASSAVLAFLLGAFGFSVLLRSRGNFTLLLLAVYILFYVFFRRRDGFA